MISAIVHTYNEEKTIDRCLSSLSWCDERVIIDMGSSDKTCAIAKEHRTKIYIHPYTGFVEPARNFDIEKAKGEWILIVDADEEVSSNLSHYLTIEAGNPKGDYYRLSRKNLIFGKWIRHAGWWPDYQIRFFTKGAVSWTKQLHGIPITHGIGVDLEAIESLSIIHHNYQTLEQFLDRLNRYSAIAAKELHLAGKKFEINSLFKKPAQEFIRRYFIWEGYKDGIHGLTLSFLQAFSELITYLKLWEIGDYREGRIDISQIGGLIENEYRDKEYWILSTLLKEPRNIMQDLLWRIKRKLNNHGR